MTDSDMEDADMQAFRESLRELRDEGGESSLPDEELAALLTDELSDDERDALIRRALDAPDGAERFRELLLLHRAAEAADPEAELTRFADSATLQRRVHEPGAAIPEPATAPMSESVTTHESVSKAAPEAPKSVRGRWRAAGLAAGLLLGAILIGRFADRSERTATPPAIAPTTAPSRALTAPAITTSLGAETVLPREAFVLQWQLQGGPADGVTYDLLVSGATRRLASLQGLIEPSYRLSSELDGIAAGESIYFKVTARLSDGRTIDSDTFVVGLE